MNKEEAWKEVDNIICAWAWGCACMYNDERCCRAKLEKAKQELEAAVIKEYEARMNKDEQVLVSKKTLSIYMRGMPPIAYPETEAAKAISAAWYDEYFAARNELREALSGNE